LVGRQAEYGLDRFAEYRQEEAIAITADSGVFKGDLV
jgi:hypothetical protein